MTGEPIGELEVTRMKAGRILLLLGSLTPFVVGTWGQTIVNNTRSLDLVNVEISEAPPYAIGLTVVNTSELAIIECIVSIDAVDVRDRFLREPLSGGKIWVLRHQSTSFPSRIGIDGILFEDGTGEGNWKKLKDSLSFLEGYGEGLHELNTILSAWLEEKRLLNQRDLAREIGYLRRNLSAVRDELASSKSGVWAQDGAKTAFNEGNRILLELEENLYIEPSESETILKKPTQEINVLNRFLDRGRIIEKRISGGTNGILSNGGTEQ